MGGVSANRIARWDGETWSALGDGVNKAVDSLSVFEDRAGKVLVAGGLFDLAGGVPVNHIAAWDGFSWSSLGSGVGGGLGMVEGESVYSFETYDDGSGPGLFVGGYFVNVGGVPFNSIAKWQRRGFQCP